MALAPSVSRSAMVPTITSKYPVGVPVATVASDTVTEIDDRAALNADGEEARFNPWVSHNKGGEQSRQQFRRMPTREFNSALLENTSESFVTAFSGEANVSEVAAGFRKRATKAALRNGISSYVTTAAVIHDDLPAMGDNVSLKL